MKKENVREELLKRVLSFVKGSKIGEEEVYENVFIVENKYGLIDDLIEIVSPLLDDNEEVELADEGLLKRVLSFVKASEIGEEEVYENEFIVENKYGLIDDLIEIVSSLLDNDEEAES